MLTRSLYLVVGWFAVSLMATLAGGHRVRIRNPFFSIGWLGAVILIGDTWALLTFGVPGEIQQLSLAAFLFGLIWIFVLGEWNSFGQVTWSMTLLATLLFIEYSFMVTAFTPLNAISFVIAIDFFLIEAIALLMALTHAYESLDLFCRVTWDRRVQTFKPAKNYKPMVSLHVPAYNEPAEVVEQTLKSLAKLDYPRYEVLVVDNNTPNQEEWQKIRNLAKQLGPRFRFVHLDKWPGYKAGALNFALAHTAPEAEIVGSVDADYVVEPDFLRELTPAFADPKVGFVQAPQDYRDYQGQPFTESAYHGYKYFFEVSMPVRNEYNAIIFCGTMGLIRKSALQEIGGWDEWCITEDAEASLRLLKHGYTSHYVNRSFGHGLMPFTFEDLKKQRFRWCFGGIQILRKHWSALMPWAHLIDPTNKLTMAQRYFYLVGGLQWFTDVLNLIFGVFLTLGAISAIFYGWFSVRPIVNTLLIIPAVFLLLHMWRFLWVLRHALQLPMKVALRSMYSFFSLGWAVSLACVQGLIRDKGVFLRTPKSKGRSRTLRALRATQWESLIGATFLTFGAGALVVRPSFLTLWLAILLAWQASLFLSAPYFSLLSVQAKWPKGLRFADIDRGKPILENKAARGAAIAVAGLVLLIWIASLLPQPTEPVYARIRPLDISIKRLFGLEQLPLEERDDTATPTMMPSATSPPPNTPAPATNTPDLTSQPPPTETPQP